MARFRVIIRDGNMPNLMLTGPPGTGKTTTIMCLARALLGDRVGSAVLELNASDDRGLDVVRNRIKAFAQKKVTLPPGRHKIVILDEADSMTEHAQQALRRTMEVFSSTTRFALACNFSQKVIEPIQSRCAVVRFGRLEDREVLARVLDVVEAEKVAVTDDGLEAILYTSDGDLRAALNNLQAAHVGFQAVTGPNVYKVCDVPTPTDLDDMLSHALNGRVDGAVGALNRQITSGFAPQDIIAALFKYAQNTTALSDVTHLEVLRTVAMHQVRSGDGSGSLVQALGCIGKLATLGARARARGAPLYKPGVQGAGSPALPGAARPVGVR